MSRRDLVRGAIGLGAAIAVPGALAACGGSGSSSGATTSAGATAAAETGAAETQPATTAATTGPTTGGTALYSMDGGIQERLDPHAVTVPSEWARTLNVFERLAAFKVDSFEVEPWLAESIEANADSTAWQIKLKPGITFQDGKPLTADDVLFSLQRVGLDDAQPYFAAFEFMDLNAARKVDDVTIDLPLTRPYGLLPKFLTQHFTSIVADGTTTFDDPKALNGTGPFKLDQFVPGQRTVLARNETYWVDGKPYLDSVDFLPVPPDSALSAVMAGQIDISGGIKVPQGLELQGQIEGGEIDLKLIPEKGVDVPAVYMRLDQPPFDDPRVRLALKLSLDRAEVVERIFLGQARPGNDLFGMDYPSYASDLPQREYDPEQAKALLKEAGQEGLTVELLTPSPPKISTLWKEQAKAAGITINLKVVPLGDLYNTDLYYLKWPFGETGWGGISFEDVAPQAFYANAPYNETAWRRPDWDARFKEAEGTADEATRSQLWHDLQAEVWEEGGYILPAFGDQFTISTKRLNVPVAPPGFYHGMNFKEWWIDESA